ncbi:MAG: hypothetical protein ACOYLQ_06810 [Hyphomicrobiaceae bacterium]
MGSLLDSPGRAFGLSVAIAAVILLLWKVSAGLDPIGFMAYLLRFIHVFAATIWLGLIWFVNFVQLAALAEASPEGRATLMKSVVPRVAHAFRHTSHLTVLTGVVLLISSGYLLDRYIFTTEVYVPPLRNLLVWGGTVGGLVMWGLVHFRIWPSLRVVLGETAGDDAAKERARAIIKTSARINLVLMLPVTAVMIAAAHLY